MERFVELNRVRSEKFVYPESWEPRSHLKHAFGIIDGPPEDVLLAFAPAVAGYIRERTWHPTQQFSTLPDGRLQLRLSVANTIELRTWILGHGSDVEVLAPASLKTSISAQLKAALEQYLP